jgi:hypothetical protein
VELYVPLLEFNHVAVAANLSMVNLYWKIGRIMTEDISEEPGARPVASVKPRS